jgi:chromosome segregation ATPase
VLRGALELDLYKLAPVDAVIERKWLEALERFEAAKKIATDEQIASMKEEFGDYCERAEEVVKIFYDLYLMKKADSAAPVAPCDSRGALFAQRESMEQKIAVSEKKLSALQAKKDLEESKDEVQQLREQPITAKGLFAKAKMKKLMRARENLYELMERQKAYRLKEVSDAIAEAEKTLLDEKTKLTEINEKLETQTKKYQNELERYEKELAEYNGIVAEREEKERVYASNPVAQAILAKLVSIEEKMAEYQKEIDRLNKESKPFAYNGSTFNTTEYYLQQATYRDREQRLTREKIQITGKINDLRFMLLARKPQAPFFN